MSRKLSLIILWLSFVIPFAVLIYLSFSTQWYYPALFSHPFTTANWYSLFEGSSGLFQSMGLSLFISLTVSFCATAGGFFLSRGIAYYTNSRWWLVSAYFPYVIAPVVLAVMLNYYFLQIGISGTIFGVMAAQLMITLPYAVIFFHGYWSHNVRNLENLVATMGGNFIQRVKHGMLPSAKGLLVICFFQCYLISWFEYGLTQFIGIGKVETLTIMVYRFVGESNPYLAALAGTLLIGPPVVLLFVNRKFIFQKGWSL